MSSNQKIDFPRIWKTAEDFEAMGLPKDTLWTLKWKGADLERPIHELVELWLNGSLESKVNQITMSNNKTIHAQVSSSVLMDIYFPIINKALGSGSDQIQSSIAFQTVFKNLKELFIEDEEELRMYYQKDDFHSILAAWCNRLSGLTSSLGETNE